MILESVENGPLIWPTVEENGVNRTKKYDELSTAGKIQADCDMKATNIILQGLPANINSLLQQQFSPSQFGSIHPNQHYSSTYPSQPQFNHSSVPSSYPYQSQMNHQTSSVPQIAYQSPQVTTQPMTEPPLMDSNFVIPVFSPRDDPIACLNKEIAFLTVVASSRFPSTNNQLRTSSNPRHQANIQDGRTEDLDAYDSDCDDILNAQAVLMVNISNYGSNIILEVPHSETYLNDMENQSVHAMQNFEQTRAQEDSIILFVIEQMSEQMINHVNNWEKANKEQNNESVTAKLGREKLALKEQVDSLEHSYQNPFHLKKSQRIKPTLYDGIVMYDKHVAMPMINDEETLILKEKSRSKMSEKAKDPDIINKNISHKPIDYEKLNRLSEDFGKRFTPQQEMDAKQAFWLHISNPTSKPSDASPVKIKAPKELPKVSLVNESLKKLKFHLARFDNVVKIRTTPDARTEEFFAYNDLKAQLQDKDNTIYKLKDMIKSMKENSKDENVKYDYCQIETKNVELENSVAKLLSENERLCNEINLVKLVFKENFDSIKKTYNAFVITSLKNDSRKIKGKEIVDSVAQIPSANTIVPGMFKLDLDPLAPRITSANIVPHKNTTSHSVETQKPELKVYSRKPKNVKNVGSSKKAKIVESKNANHSEPNHTWGSTTTNIPSSSSLFMIVRFENDHIARIMGYGNYQLGNVTISRLVKSKKSSYIPKAEDTNQEKLYLLHMDLCGPMHVASINGKRYILVIVDDYSRFTWVRFLRTKDEAPEAIIRCIKNIQVHLNATVRNVRTDNGTEFVNQTLHEFYENVGILHQTSVARTPQQNGFRTWTSIYDSCNIQVKTRSKHCSQQPCIPPPRDDWNRLFQPMFDDYFTPPPIAVTPVQEVAAL
ncbi:retrovirus-related pol polyprotein from transposon TNT 1-94 [Tanacetum coccineum]